MKYMMIFFTVGDSTGVKIRSFYSHKSSLTLLLYWYKEYSKINISVILSATTCKSVLLDPCLFSMECDKSSNQCHNYLRNITFNSGVSYTDITRESLNIYLNNSDCAIIQFVTHETTLPMQFREKCFVHLFSRLGTTITEINGILNKVPTKAPEYKSIRPEFLHIFKLQLCTKSSKTFCVKDDLGINVPWVERNTSRFKIDIHPNSHELITATIMHFLPFSKSWVNFVVEKVKTDTKIPFNKIGRTLNTVNADVIFPYIGNMRFLKCFVTLHMNNISQQYMDNAFLHVEFTQLVRFNPSSNQLDGLISSK